MPKPVFLLVPEWQGSPSSRAMQLAEGAEALREDLPRTATHEVSVPLEAGDAMGTPVARLSSVVSARDATRGVLTELAADGESGAPIIVGGDCASSLAGLEAASANYGDAGLAVLWFDAHPDLQHPSTSPSGAASGMVLRHALGDGSADLASRAPIDPTLITLVGTRMSDPEEDVERDRHGIVTIETPGVFDDEDPAAFAALITERLSALGAHHLYVHIDLDVLDPAEFAAVHASAPFGLTIAQLTAGVRAAVAAVPLAGAAICEFAPTDAAAAAEDLPTVLRILGALTSGGAA